MEQDESEFDSDFGAAQAAKAIFVEDNVGADDSEDEIGPGEAAAAFRLPVLGPYTSSSFTCFHDSWLDE